MNAPEKESALVASKGTQDTANTSVNSISQPQPNVNTISPFLSPAAHAEYVRAATRFMEEDLAKSGLTPEDIGAAVCPPYPGVSVAYRIPYPGIEKFTRRGLVLPNSDGKKYKLQSRTEIGDLVLWPYIPAHQAPQEILDIVEGEKKAAVLRKAGLFAIGISGCDNWRDPQNRDKPHPEILRVAANGVTKAIRLNPDGDLATNFNVNAAFGEFGRALQFAGFTVQVAVPPPNTKIDDLIAEFGLQAAMSKLTYTTPTELGIRPKALVAYIPHLTYSTNEDTGKVTIPATEGNFAKILRGLFQGRLWFDMERKNYMLDDAPWIDNLTVPAMLEKFQSVLGFNTGGTRGNKASLNTIQTAMLQVARENVRWPFREYLESLKWDGTPRLKTWLCDYCHAEPGPATEEVAIKQLVAGVGRIYEPGCDLRAITVLVGPQGFGKSGLPRVFYGPDYTVVLLAANAHGKDGLQIQTAGHTVCYDEFDAISTKRGVEELKTQLSLTHVFYRPPFERTPRNFPLSCTRWASSNRTQILRLDPSGYSRYAIVEIPKMIDFAGLYAVREQLWAEAVQLYKAGGVRWNCWEHQEPNTRLFTIESTLIGHIEKFLKHEEMPGQKTEAQDPSRGGREGRTFVWRGAGARWIFFDDLCSWLSAAGYVDGRNTAHQQNIKDTLAHMGFLYSKNGVRREGVNVRSCWLLPDKKSDTADTTKTLKSVVNR